MAPISDELAELFEETEKVEADYLTKVRLKSAHPWPQMDEAAFHGFAGKVARTIGPHSEADPAAILLQTLVCAGNVIGRGPSYQVESDRHHLNLFTVLVGTSSKARKGTSMGRVTAVVKVADERWCDERVKGGLSSGEGLINEVRDEVKNWNAKDSKWESADPGVTDKRLLLIEPEFAAVLSGIDRSGNTLSPILRKAWDGGKLATLTRNSRLSATGAHTSIVGHITVDELRARIARTDLANGFANRFLFVLVKRSKELPFGGNLTDSEILHLGEQLKEIVEGARKIGLVRFTEAAGALWARVYSSLSAEQPGLLGAITARAEAQVIRLATLYAVLDNSTLIDVAHLKAGLAIWEYCDASAAHIFGDAIGDPVADEIWRALQHAGSMTRTEIRDLFGRNRTADRLGAALALLMSKGRAKVETRETGGRPVEVWSAVQGVRHG